MSENTELPKRITVLTGEPVVSVIAEMRLVPEGLEEMVNWVRDHRPECLPEELTQDSHNVDKLFPHDLWDNRPPPLDRSRRELTHNELLVELAGRTCYHSFGLKAGKKSNAEYIAHTQQGDVPHSSILYHAKISFFIAGVSRRVSHEFIRNYVGSDRDEEGAPSQESTRFTHHYGFFIMPPRYLKEYALGTQLSRHFEESMQLGYSNYLSAVKQDVEEFAAVYGKPPTSMDRKRIYEAASSFLPHQAETSFVWTSNPMALAKFCRERDHEAADLEMQRFARKMKQVVVGRYPNLFPQPWMRR